MNIASVFQQQAERHPDRVALIESRKGRSLTVTFAELEQRAAQTVALFKRSGLKAGDAVLVFVPMSVTLYVVLVALFRLNVVAMFIDPSAGREHIERCCRLYPPQGFIGTPKAHLLRLWTPALRAIPHQFVTHGWVPGSRSLVQVDRLQPVMDLAPAVADTPALVTFTSGSTGQPKVAVRDHGFLLAQHRVLARCLNYDENDVVVSTLPIFVLSHLGSGVTSLLPQADLRRPGAVDPVPIVKQMKSHAATAIEASPAFLACLTGHPQRDAVPSLKKVFTGGAPVFPSLLERFAALAPHAELVAVYGSTEAEPIAEVSLAEMAKEDLQKMQSGGGLLAGKPIAAIRLRVLPDRFGTPIGPFSKAHFEAQCLPPGSPGEITVRGVHVLPGYLHGEGDEENKFQVDGQTWHRTGDAGYLDAQGRLWLLGRCTARIEDERGVLYPFAVEAAISDMDEIRRSAFVAHHDQRVLVLELRPGVSKALLQGVKKRLDWAYIDAVKAMKIPVDKRHNAKVDYPALFEQLEREAAR